MRRDQNSADHPGRWAGHTRMSHPGKHALLVADLPAGVGALISVVQGLLIHSDWLDAYPIEKERFSGMSRETLPIADRLSRILENSALPLHVTRPPCDRSVGTCRDYALMLCSLLRSHEVPARLRCGFASYFGERWEDHWVCEYWDSAAATWRLGDAQLDDTLRDRLAIPFDHADVPRGSFVAAGQAWRECRAGQADPERFGCGAVAGMWFLKVNVLRDHGALNNRETSPWDGWRDAPPARRRVGAAEMPLLDRVAADPAGAFVDAGPDWLG
jgi:Transglutaminase-like superfamily